MDFYPRPPRGGRLFSGSVKSARYSISIHALREEGDRAAGVQNVQYFAFLSTPSARRATRGTGERAGRNIFLSTPSARRATPPAAAPVLSMSDFYPRPPRGGRPGCGRYCNDGQNFYPRPPRGGRRSAAVAFVLLDRFLSTPSARRATQITVPCLVYAIVISIHALREEGDKARFLAVEPPLISIHALREEGDVSPESLSAAS